jgi:cell division transport system permease protein
VGATRWFIAKPINIRAVINGLIAAFVAIGLLVGFIFLVETFRPEIKVLRDNRSMFLLFASIILLGVIINLLSTHSAVIKYLKMKLDELY